MTNNSRGFCFVVLFVVFYQNVMGFNFEDRTMPDCRNAGLSCSKHSSCKFDLDKNHLTCFCAVGYKGEFCDADRNECNIGSAPCKRRGVCHNFIGSLRTENLCEHGSTCVNVLGNFSCRCANGWEGRICSEDINECNLTADLCHNGGNCINNPGSYRCDCPYPYTGASCDVISTSLLTTTLTYLSITSTSQVIDSTQSDKTGNSDTATSPALTSHRDIVSGSDDNGQIRTTTKAGIAAGACFCFIVTAVLVGLVIYKKHYRNQQTIGTYDNSSITETK